MAPSVNDLWIPAHLDSQQAAVFALDYFKRAVLAEWTITCRVVSPLQYRLSPKGFRRSRPHFRGLVANRPVAV